MLKDPFLPRLLKKVQKQGGVRCARYPPMVGRRRTWYVRHSAARARGYPPQVGHSRWAFGSGLLHVGDRILIFVLLPQAALQDLAGEIFPAQAKGQG